MKPIYKSRLSYIIFIALFIFKLPIDEISRTSIFFGTLYDLFSSLKTSNLVENKTDGLLSKSWLYFFSSFFKNYSTIFTLLSKSSGMFSFIGHLEIQIFSSIIDTYNSEIQLADLNNDETITILDAILLINIIMY